MYLLYKKISILQISHLLSNTLYNNNGLFISNKLTFFSQQHSQSYQQIIKNEPQQNNTSTTNYASVSQKKRLLAKAQSECMLNVPTKQEPGIEYHHRDNYAPPPQQQNHCSGNTHGKLNYLLTLTKKR